MTFADLFFRLKHTAKRRLSSLLARVDKQSVVDRRAMLNRFAKLRNSTIGQYSYVGPRTILDNVDVGSFCSISWDCCIGLSSHPSNLVSTSPIFFERHNGTGTSWLEADVVGRSLQRTKIGSDVWIGANCLIMEGVKIGHGAIVAAGSVVTKDIAPYAIFGGVPARYIRLRFEEDVVEALLQKEWWDAPEEELKAVLGKFSLTPLSVDIIRALPGRN